KMFRRFLIFAMWVIACTIPVLLAILLTPPAKADVTIPDGTRPSIGNLDMAGNKIFRVREIYLRDGDTNTMKLAAPSALADDNTVFVLPADNGTAGQALKTDGSGNTSWTDMIAHPGDDGTANQSLLTDGSGGT